MCRDHPSSTGTGRSGISRYSKWKKWHQYPPRPIPEKPGILVQIDSMQEGVPRDALRAYAMIDVCSRWAYVEATARTTSHASVQFVRHAQGVAPFSFHTLQSDHGSEFSKWFTKVVVHAGIQHHHSRVRTPTDNAYVERFIQTLQKDCLNRITTSMRTWRRAIPDFLHYYNHERPHMGLNMQTPMEVLRRY
jgi:transposase InsO family protein